MGLRQWWSDAKAEADKLQDFQRDTARLVAAADADQLGFRARAAYVGGHPDLTKPSMGALLLLGDELRFRSESAVQELVIPAASIEGAEYHGSDDLRKPPKGYVIPLPIPWIPGYGGQPKHPVSDGLKLTKLLVVAYKDARGSFSVAFANGGMLLAGAMGMDAPDSKAQELANQLVAARAARPRAT